MKNNTVAELNTDINDVAEEFSYIAGITESSEDREIEHHSSRRKPRMEMILTYDQVMHLLTFYTRQNQCDSGRYTTFFPHPWHYKTLNPAIAAVRIDRGCYESLSGGQIDKDDRYYCKVAQYTTHNRHRVPVLLVYKSYLDNTEATGFFSIFQNPAAHDLVVRSFPGEKIS